MPLLDVQDQKGASSYLEGQGTAPSGEGTEADSYSSCLASYPFNGSVVQYIL